MLKHKTKNMMAALLTGMIMTGITVSAIIHPVLIDESLMAELEEHIARQDASLSESEIKELAQALYQEKYIDEPPTLPAEEQSDFADVAYENMLAKENYIVELISSHSGEATSRDAWEYNLAWLEYVLIMMRSQFWTMSISGILIPISRITRSFCTCRICRIPASIMTLHLLHKRFLYLFFGTFNKELVHHSLMYQSLLNLFLKIHKRNIICAIG